MRSFEARRVVCVPLHDMPCSVGKGPSWTLGLVRQVTGEEEKT